MVVLDLFSGVGGFSLGLERAGMKTVAFCEIEPFCQKVLKKHWPEVPIYEDIRKLDGTQYRGTIDLVCGGFPCQPYSSAGNRQGQADDRALWPEMFRVIREVQPTWVIGENVDGFRTMGLDDSLSDLESAGYACQTFDIPACGVGANHIRHRLWIVAYANPALRNKSGRPSGESRESQAKFTNNGEFRNFADPCSNGLQGQCFPPKNKPASDRKHARCKAPGRSEATNTVQPPTESPVCSPDDGISDRVARLKALGNAVVPQIPEIIGRAIMNEQNQSTE